MRVANVVNSRTRDENGFFEFVGVPPGVYTVKEVTPNGYLGGADSDGGVPNKIVANVTTLNKTNVVFVDELPSSAPSVSSAPLSAPSASLSGSSIPLLEPSSTPSVSPSPSVKPSGKPSLSAMPSSSILGSISCNVSEDLDNNDSGDIDLFGVTIILYDNNGDVVATTVADPDGNYLFSDLPAGKYRVTETNLRGYLDVSYVDGPTDNVIGVPLALVRTLLVVTSWINVSV